ncbi:MAG TPA: aminodeoxychorismate synthase component I [Ktedonobacterales bacterium]
MRYKPLPSHFYQLLTEHNNAVLLESARCDAENHHSLLFLDPVEVLRIDQVTDVGALLEHIQQVTERGYYAAGYLSYECGAFFEPRLRSPEARSSEQPCAPLAWFGVYRAPLVFDHVSGRTRGQAPNATSAAASMPTGVGGYQVGDLHFDLSAAHYARRIARITEHIIDGDVYQINFTGRYHFALDGSPLALYLALKRSQPVPYAAYVRAGEHSVVCLSPELFFRLTGETIITKPMKGTAPRGRTLGEDIEHAASLRADEKNRAENVMIVDLLRNDLGRVCEVGSVHVPRLFEVERYASLLQMTSTVAGTLAGPLSYPSLFRSLFPCGSVTGAPKIRAMQIIQELEDTPRGVYTGSIGYCGPSGPRNELPHTAMFNVAIRTLMLHGGSGEMGIGSGIVFDSTAASEYAECLLKARFLTEIPPDFALIETIGWHGRYRWLGRHLRRLADSAAYFEYPFHRPSILATLAEATRGFDPARHYKVRLVVDRHGTARCDCARIEAPSRMPSAMSRDASQPGATVTVSEQRTSSGDRFLFHKTTHRALYDVAHRQAAREGHADVLILNERDEVTEGAISNVFVRRGGLWLTPPLRCGLLGGVYRQHVLATRSDAREAVLHLDDLRSAEAIAICNAIRGWRLVHLA